MMHIKNIGLSAVLAAGISLPFMAVAQTAPFSRVIEANGVIYLAGHLGRDSETRKYGKTMGAQTKAPLENIGATLETVNASHADIVRCQVFMTDISKFSEMNAAYRKFFP